MQQAISKDLPAMDDGMMKKVLIVDDEEDMIWSLQKNLPNSKLQVETLTASSGEEALEVLNQTAVDLIVTDIKMPGMSGLDLLSEVNNRYPHLGVIVMTAFSSQEWETEAILRGGYAYIEKPFDINEMRRVINQALQGKEDALYSEVSGEDMKDVSALAMEIPGAGENESPDYIVKTPENVQAILSEEGDIEDSIVHSLLNFSIEDLLDEDDLVSDATVLVDGRSIEDTIVESLIGVAGKSKPAPAQPETRPLVKDAPSVINQEKSPLVKDEPRVINRVTSTPEDDKPAPAGRKHDTQEDDGPLETGLEASAPETSEPAATSWVISTRDDSEPAAANWVINTRDSHEPEETVQETPEPENDEGEETEWVIRTRDNYEPARTNWVIRTRDKCKPEKTVQETGAPENDQTRENKWVIRVRDDS